MRKLLICAMLLVAPCPGRADAGTFAFTFSGPGVSGTIRLTYGTATDAKYPQAFEVTGISGTFSDANNGLNIVDAPIESLVAIRHDTPEPTNLLAPDDFSRFAVATGLPEQSNGFLTYTNLFWPNGSPQTASDYPFHGGFLDIYGLLFNIGGGRVVNVWSNGDFSPNGTGPIDYGVAVATSDNALDYVASGVSVVPEPGALVLLSIGLAGMLAWRRAHGSAIAQAA
jgi:PEP-CTERM motif